ncbi:MAG: cupin domain-containing protein [Dehalococcoidia bacterium]|nr:MAG: cupin domain-containing protein [Dehalococcoidia bacterium]
MRRVVTGHTADGKAVIANDTEIDSVTIAPGWELIGMWNASEPPVFPNDGSPPEIAGPRPDVPVGGFNFGLFNIPPHTGKGDPGFHITDTIDLGYVISGEVWLELDDGKEVDLRPGDTIVQNGTRHAWRNKGSETCTIVMCMIGAHRKELMR